MRPRSTIAHFAFAHALAVTRVFAQPNLPPPPPPPMGEPTDVAPSASSSASSPAPVVSPLPPHPAAAAIAPVPPPGAASTSASAGPHRAPLPPAPLPSSLRAGARRHHAEVYISEWRRRPVALTLSPLPLAWGRLSAAAEVLIAPHHALVASPNLLFVEIDRGGRSSFVSEGFGFASTTSSSVGVELGYHYWSHARDSLRGPFFGPSILVGDTSQSTVDPSHAQGYWGLALDGGGQEVFPGGFTLGGGAGLGFVRMAGATAVFPRVLIQIGWSP